MTGLTARVLLLTSILLLSAVPGRSADDPSSLYREIVRSCGRNQPSAAADAYRRLRRAFPADPLTVKAELALIETNRDYFDTLARYRIFLKDHPGFDGTDAILFRLGQLYYIHNNFTEALSAFNRVISNFPASTKRPPSLYWAGNIRFYRTETAVAEALFREASLSSDRSTAGASLVRLGDLGFERKQYWTAITNYKSALKSLTDPELRLETEFNLGESYFGVLNHAEAVKFYSAVSRDHPGTEYARLSDERLAFIYMKSPWLRKSGTGRPKQREETRRKIRPAKPLLFFVQTGSFTDLRLANNLRLELKTAGFPSGISHVAEGDHYQYKVRAGPYPDQASADATSSEIVRKLKLEAFTVQETE